MTTFDDRDVADFLRTVHGREPFPWQLALARAAQHGSWPAAVDAPTGLGKTWSLDVAVLAMAAAGLQDDRSVFRRVFFVVDRRTVVDEAYQHALGLAKALKRAAPGSLVGNVADGLRRLMGDVDPAVVPLVVTRMRGGVTWDDRWVDRPDQPSIVVSTVDQVGSRLLFRGYGVSDRMRSIDAAMTGTYSLILLDEAHLSRPFAAVLDLLRRGSASTAERTPVHVVSLSATQRDATDVLDFDVDAHLENVTARQRLLSDKRLATLAATPGTRPKMITSVVREAVATDGIQRVLVVCNTVAGARSVYDLLRAAVSRVALLTGRSRPVDRERVAEKWIGLLGAEVDDAADTQGPIVLVATQTVEVGVNIDVDFLVTEECALDALVQRLGRLNRFGTRAGSAVVVTSGIADPVYGDAAPNTSALLAGWGAAELDSVKSVLVNREAWLDVSPLALRGLMATVDADRLDGHSASALTRAAPASPLLDLGLVDGWARTSPVPVPDVPVEPYLHGLSDADTTVLVAWRSDMTWGDEVLSLPVVSAECVEISLSAVRAWLANSAVPPMSDLDGASAGGDEPVAVEWVRRVVEGTRVEAIHPSRVRPGDTLVFPADAGGLDEWGWAPQSVTPALDVADLVRRRDAFLMRLSEATLRPLIQGHLRPGTVRTTEENTAWAAAASAARTVRAVLDSDDHESLTASLSGLKRALDGAVTANRDLRFMRLLERLDDAKSWAGSSEVLRLDGRRDSDPSAGDLSAAEDASEVASSIIGAQVSLSRHSEAVGSRARHFATNLGLDPSLVETVARAGEWHDLGKRDRRFQAMLWGGVLPFGTVDPLAKSGLPPRSRLARRAHQLSRYPRGMRHEALSASLVRAWLDSRAGEDQLGRLDGDLLVHLVASHHGRARPLAATVDDPDPAPVVWDGPGATVTVSSAVEEDLSWSSRFDELNRRYGHWRLAMLESLVRLSDISCSREGS